MKIGVIGTGYVGLVVGACLAESGNTVICGDVDEKKISMLKDGKSPIYEPGLDDLLVNNIEKNRLFFTTDIPYLVKNSTIIYIAVGTPSLSDGSADLSSVFAVAETIGKNLDSYKVVVTKSTVPIGTTDRVRGIIKSLSNVEFDVVSNPEFLKEGAAVLDFMKPDRIVVGTDSDRARSIMQELYAPFVRTDNPIIFTDIKSAEMIKYAANAMLATRISFMNEIARLCEKVGANVHQVRRGIGSDPRIGKKFLFPGAGFGGSCFPKDLRAIINTGRENGLKLKILEAVYEVNEEQKLIVAKKVLRFFQNSVDSKKIAVWGLSFKPNTNDMREAPSIVIISELLKQGAKIYAYDPAAIDEAKKIFKDKSGIHFVDSSYEAVEGADCLVVVTEWNEFRTPDFDLLASKMKQKVIFDGRNLYNPETLKSLGFRYFGIGIGEQI